MFFHIDMDAYFASVEQLDNPELRGKPVIISGQASRSVVSTASYEARKYGVHSAMPFFQAKKLCPHGIFMKGRMGRYKEISLKIFSLLDSFSPLVEPVSIDEAYLNMYGCERLSGLPHEAAASIRDKILSETGLTCSIGVAPVKFLSKIASDMKKPNGITIITREEMMPFILNLDIKKVPGVGKSTYRVLETLSVKRLGDIKRIPDSLLTKKLGKQGERLKQLANGYDGSDISLERGRKSISSENTLPEDTTDMEKIRRYMLYQSDDVARQLRKKEVKSKTVVLKITFHDFRKITRRVTLDTPVFSAEKIYQEAVKLLENENIKSPVRLVGVGCASLTDEKTLFQGTLFDGDNGKSSKWETAEKAIDSVLDRFGKTSLTRAVFKD